MLALISVSACQREPVSQRLPVATPVIAIGGFDGPEAVKYDPAQDVWFVSNFGGEGAALDDNGFISRLKADGTVDSLRFISGGRGGVTLHMPRGMALRGDTLWVADADAVRGFDRRTGAGLAVVDFTTQSPGFLNDLAYGADGALYVTDTGKRVIYRIMGNTITVSLPERSAGGLNGITWDSAGNRFLLAPYPQGRSLLAWLPGGAVTDVSEGRGGRYDGVEIIGPDSFLVASQNDSSLHLFSATSGTPILGLAGAPADIGWDARRRVVAVPYVNRDTVELFRLP